METQDKGLSEDMILQDRLTLANYRRHLTKFMDPRNGNHVEWCYCGYPCEVVRGGKYRCGMCTANETIEKLSQTVKNLRRADDGWEV